jgi:hypothetical protein
MMGLFFFLSVPTSVSPFNKDDEANSKSIKKVKANYVETCRIIWFISPETTLAAIFFLLTILNALFIIFL